MAKRPVVVLVAGLPASGKTTIAERIGDTLGLPFFGKDHFKETLFDTLGWSNHEWSHKLGAASMELLYLSLEAELRAGRSCIVEANFDPTHALPRLAALHERYPFEPFQIQCVADGEVLYRRYRERADSGERHPGHLEQDQQLDKQRAALLPGRTPSLDIGGTLIELDTTNFAALDLAPVLDALRVALAHAKASADDDGSQGADER